MRKSPILFTIVALFFFLPAALAEEAPEETFNAVIKIRAQIPKDARTARTLGTEREGNGVLIDSQGHVLTIGYLIVEAETIEAYDRNGKSISVAFVGYDYNSGFGLLRLKSPLGITPLKLGDSDEIKEGDRLLVAGYGGSENARGVQVIVRKEFAGNWEYLIDEAIFTFPPYLKFGGAALIDQNGQLMGIGSLLTQLVIPDFGLVPSNMFVPINLIKPILTDLIAFGRPATPPRPWLGLYVDEIGGHLIVTRVLPEGPAEKAGLQPGDIILQVNNQAVEGLADFYRKVWAMGPAGVEVPLVLLQGNQIRQIGVKSSDRYQFLRSFRQETKSVKLKPTDK
ncbi:MAG: S1C family serine protease [Thermodesulfobacteriota bacterium]